MYRESNGDLSLGISSCLKQSDAYMDDFAKRHGIKPTYTEWAVSKQGSKSIEDAIVKFRADLDRFGATHQ